MQRSGSAGACATEEAASQRCVAGGGLAPAVREHFKLLTHMKDLE